MADENCRDETMRDLLPPFAHDALEGREAERVRAHLAGCATCRAELALVESAAAAISAAVPPISTAAIVAEVQRATRLRLEPRSARGARPARRLSHWMPRRYAAAAASLILVASASLAVLARTFGGPDMAASGGATGSAVDTAMGGRVMASAAAGISVAGGLADLSEDELAALLAELDRVEATVAAEPTTLRRALVDDQENF